MFAIADRFAVTDAPVMEAISDRWSTRIFDASAPIDEAALASALEAARWAPSASNTQPWRAIVARRGTTAHEKVFGALMGFNQAWAGDAGALVVFLARSVSDEGEPLPWAVYDTGQAAAFFTVQAHEGGLYSHQMGGFERERLSEAFDLDPTLTPLAVMAVGALGDPASAPESILAREQNPRTRRPVSESVIVDA